MQSSKVQQYKNSGDQVSFENLSPAFQQLYRSREFSADSKTENNPFLDDILTIQNSYIFRRLQGIYQFDIRNDGFKYQNRLSHTVLTATVSEQICHKLNLSYNSICITRAISLIHDIGHPPFGHRGERAIRQFLQKNNVVSDYNHDLMGVLLVTRFAKTSNKHPGLNLSIAVIEGLVKRFWRYRNDLPLSHFNHSSSEIPAEIIKLNNDLKSRFGIDLRLEHFSHIEGQISAISDWIAFTATDIVDGLRNKLIKLDELIKHFPLFEEIYKKLKWEDLQLNSEDLLLSLAQHIQDELINDVVHQTHLNIKKAIQAGLLKSAEDVGKLPELLVTFSPDTMKHIKSFGDYCNDSVFPRIAEYFSPPGLALVKRPFEQLCISYLDGLYSGKIPMPKLNSDFHWPDFDLKNPEQRARHCVQIFTTEIEKTILNWHAQNINTHRLFIPAKPKKQVDWNPNQIRSNL